MTVETYENNTAATVPGLRPPPDMVEYVKTLHSIQEIMGALVQSHFIPAAYRMDIPRNASSIDRRDAERVTIANATAAALMGRSVGLDPLQSLQNIYVIHGRPGMYARIKVALVMAAGCEVWTEEYTPEKVTVCGKRKGSQRVETVTLTIEDAKRAGWDSNPNYRKTPADMLYARCSGRVADRVGGNILFGIATLEDLYDIEDDPQPQPVQLSAQDISRYRTGSMADQIGERPDNAFVRAQLEREAQSSVALDRDQTHVVGAAVADDTGGIRPNRREPNAAPYEPHTPPDRPITTVSGLDEFAPEQPVNDQEVLRYPGGDDGIPYPTEPPMMTEPQKRKMNALFNQLDIRQRDRESRLLITNRLITNPERTEPITSSLQLTKAEASELIDKLETLASAPDPAAGIQFLLADEPRSVEGGEEDA